MLCSELGIGIVRSCPAVAVAALAFAGRGLITLLCGSISVTVAVFRRGSTSTCSSSCDRLPRNETKKKMEFILSVVRTLEILHHDCTLPAYIKEPISEGYHFLIKVKFWNFTAEQIKLHKRL